MAYRWKPNASQRREFAQRMNNPEERAAYYEAKERKAEIRRSGSSFDYASAGGMYVPTQAQYNFCYSNMHLALDSLTTDAFNQVMYGYTCQEKIPHDCIHIVNELFKKQAV